MSVRLIHNGTDVKKRKQTFLHDYEDVKKSKLEISKDSHVQIECTSPRHALHPTQENREGSCETHGSDERFQIMEEVTRSPSYVPFYGKRLKPGSKSMENFFSNCENIAMKFRKSNSHPVSSSCDEKVTENNTKCKSVSSVEENVKEKTCCNTVQDDHPTLQVLQSDTAIASTVSCSFSDNSDSCSSNESHEQHGSPSMIKYPCQLDGLDKVVRGVVNDINSQSSRKPEDPDSDVLLWSPCNYKLVVRKNGTSLSFPYPVMKSSEVDKEDPFSIIDSDKISSSTSSPTNLSESSDSSSQSSGSSDSSVILLTEMDRDLPYNLGFDNKSTTQDGELLPSSKFNGHDDAKFMTRKTKPAKSTNILHYFTPARNSGLSDLDASKSLSANMEAQEYSFSNGLSRNNSVASKIPTLDQLLANSSDDAQRSANCSKSPASRKTKLSKGKKMEQLYIDAGQKDFGHVCCPTCGMVYTKAQEEDEIAHAKYHQRLLQKLRFKGWKTERVLRLYDDGKIVLINPEDHKLHLRKVAEVREVVDCELGFTGAADGFSSKDEKAFFFVSNQRVVGCVIAVVIQNAYPVIPTPDIPSPEKRQGTPTLSWCCSTKPVPAQCGISRIWVIKHMRRKKIAKRLIDCVRNNFIFGCVIAKEKIAFSDPTPDGRAFAEKYIGTPNILVFR